MKNFNKLLTICYLLIILVMSIIRYNVSIIAQPPYQLTYNIFPVEPYSYNATYNVTGVIKSLSLPSDSKPMGIVYDSTTGKVWVALYGNCSIASIDILTKDVTIFPLPYQIDENFSGPGVYTLTITPDKCIWFTINGYWKPLHPSNQIPTLGKLDVSNNLTFIYYTPIEFAYHGSDIKFYKDYIWLLGNNCLMKINYTTSEIIDVYFKEFGSGGFMEFDNNYLWISAPDKGFVTKFNIELLNNFEDINFTFDRPLGIEVDENYVYIAENKLYDSSGPLVQMGTIAMINKTSLEVTRLNTAPITSDGPYHVLKDIYGYLWFTDNSGHIGIVSGIVYGNEIPNCYVPPYCYFMTEVPGNTIWFSGVGSAYVGMKETGTLGRTDINKDGKVDLKDYYPVCKWYGKCVPPAPENCDINSDGKIDLKDVYAVAKNYGKTL